MQDHLNKHHVFVETSYQSLTDEMHKLQDTHQGNSENMFALGALMALSWVRDQTRSPTDILRKSDLQS